MPFYFFHLIHFRTRQRNDLIKSVDHLSANVHQGSLIKSTKSCVDPSLPGLSFVVDNSDSVHYGPLTQLIVSSGSSCHARVQITDTREKSQPLPSYRSSSPPSWVHVFPRLRQIPHSAHSVLPSLLQMYGSGSSIASW